MISFGDAAIAQSVVRNIGSVEVTGSIPVSSLKKNILSDILFLVLYVFLGNECLICIRYGFCGDCLCCRRSRSALLHLEHLLLEDFRSIWRRHECAVMRTHLSGIGIGSLRKACEGRGKVIVLETRRNLLNGRGLLERTFLCGRETAILTDIGEVMYITVFCGNGSFCKVFCLDTSLYITDARYGQSAGFGTD